MLAKYRVGCNLRDVVKEVPFFWGEFRQYFLCVLAELELAALVASSDGLHGFEVEVLLVEEGRVFLVLDMEWLQCGLPSRGS